MPPRAARNRGIHQSWSLPVKAGRYHLVPLAGLPISQLVPNLYRDQLNRDVWLVWDPQHFLQLNQQPPRTGLNAPHAGGLIQPIHPMVIFYPVLQPGAQSVCTGRWENQTNGWLQSPVQEQWRLNRYTNQPLARNSHTPAGVAHQ